MKFALHILCALVLCNSCKFAGFEKRRYRHGYFFHVSQKNKVKKEERIANDQLEEKPEVVNITNVTLEESAVANTNVGFKILNQEDIKAAVRAGISANKDLPENKFEVLQKKLLLDTRNSKPWTSSGDFVTDLIFALIVLGVIIVFCGAYLGLEYLFPGMSYLFYAITAGVIVLVLLISLIFVSVKNESFRSLKKGAQNFIN